MFARFDENPAVTLRVIKETKRYGRTHAQTDNVKTVYPLQTKFAGGITKSFPFYWYDQSFDQDVHTGQVAIMKELIYIKMFLFAQNNFSIVKTKIVECK